MKLPPSNADDVWRVRRARHGFTLVELLVVVALVGVVVAAGISGLHRRGGLAREAAVALLCSRAAEARALAVTRGRPVRLLVHADPAEPERFLRFIALAVREADGWRAIDDGTSLAEGTAVLPPSGPGAAGPGLVARSGDDWSRPSGGILRSTALSDSAAEAPVLFGTTRWLYVHFSATGGTFGGDLVVVSASRADAAVPVTLVGEEPEAVAGVALSSYGVPMVANGRSEF